MLRYQEKYNDKNYLNYIQTLRALSVLFVFFFHSNLSLFSKGYLGVDIFFVISGYVITKQLEENFFLNKKLNIGQFFMKRILKIAPVYFFILTIFLFIFLFFGPLTEYDFFKDKLKFVYLFISNIYYLNHDKNYFDNIFDDPLNHTWSLGVEMQFYIAFPFFLYFLKKNFNQIKIIKTLICIIILSVITIIYLSENKNLIFYSPVFRAWEFLQGSLIYLIKKDSKNYKTKRRNDYDKISWILFLFIIIIIFYPNKNYVTTNQLLIVFTCSLFIFFKNNNESLFFNNKALVYLGNISYSFYLWHLPIMYLSDIYLQTQYKLIADFFLTTIAAHLSYKFIEKKFKNMKIKNFILNLNLKYLYLISSILIILIFLYYDKFNKNNLKDFILINNYLEKKYLLIKRLNYTEIKINNNEIYNFCTQDSKKYTVNFYGLRNECLKFIDNERLIYVEGDSHTAIFVPLILNSFNESIYYKNSIFDKKRESIPYSYDETNRQLKNFKNVLYVRSINSIAEFNEFAKNIKNFDNKISFLIFGPIPNFYSDNIKPVKCLIHKMDCNFNISEDYKYRDLEILFNKINKVNKKISDKKITIYNPYKIICPTDNCSIYNVNNNFLIYRDNNHLTIEGSLSLKNNFNIFLKENLK
jgi:peptidoglycan/LPS O-acetylase OafA/YrhL